MGTCRVQGGLSAVEEGRSDIHTHALSEASSHQLCIPGRNTARGLQFRSQSSRAWSGSPKNHNPHFSPLCKSLLHMTTVTMSVSSIYPSALLTKNPGQTEGLNS